MKEVTTITTLEEYLSTYAEFIDKLRVRPEGFGYSCVEDYVRQNGRAWEPQELPAEFQSLRGKAKECFKNAADAVFNFDDRVRYVEGFALAEGLPLQIHHAWLVDEHDRVLEVTWDKPGTEYFGVEFNHDTLNETALARERYGIIDNPEQGFPLLRGRQEEA